MAQTNDALSVEDVLAPSGGMQGLKDVLSTVVQDALQELIEAEVTARLGAGRWERSEERDAERLTAKDGVDPGGGCRGEDPEAPQRQLLPGPA